MTGPWPGKGAKLPEPGGAEGPLAGACGGPAYARVGSKLAVRRRNCDRPLLGAPRSLVEPEQMPPPASEGTPRPRHDVEVARPMHLHRCAGGPICPWQHTVTLDRPIVRLRRPYRRLSGSGRLPVLAAASEAAHRPEARMQLSQVSHRVAPLQSLQCVNSVTSNVSTVSTVSKIRRTRRGGGL
jgi:hypothetical protein